jgi:hypothetical protein
VVVDTFPYLEALERPDVIVAKPALKVGIKPTPSCSDSRAG